MSGSSLIESLVALSVFAIGSACTATWLGWAIGVDGRASRSMAATVAAANLVERIRANRGAVMAGLYRDNAVGHGDCSLGCDAAARAHDDVRVFRSSLTAWVGVAARGFVRCEPDGLCDILVTWQGREELRWSWRF